MIYGVGIWIRVWVVVHGRNVHSGHRLSLFIRFCLLLHHDSHNDGGDLNMLHVVHVVHVVHNDYFTLSFKGTDIFFVQYLDRTLLIVFGVSLLFQDLADIFPHEGRLFVALLLCVEQLTNALLDHRLP